MAKMKIFRINIL